MLTVQSIKYKYKAVLGYCTVLYCTALYCSSSCTVLYCTVLYCTVQALYLAIVPPYTVLVTLVSTVEALVDTLVPRTTGGARRALEIEGRGGHNVGSLVFFSEPLDPC